MDFFNELGFTNQSIIKEREKNLKTNNKTNEGFFSSFKKKIV